MVGKVRLPGRGPVSLGCPGYWLVLDAINYKAKKNSMADKVHSRGLTRRLIQVALSTSVLTGSGWGIYRYQGEDSLSQANASAGQDQAEQVKASTQSEEQNQSASDELKGLLSGKLNSSSKQKVRSAPVPDKLVADSMLNADNRYARYASEKPFVESSSQSM
jgi:hypothetical protein